MIVKLRIGVFIGFTILVTNSCGFQENLEKKPIKQETFNQESIKPKTDQLLYSIDYSEGIHVCNVSQILIAKNDTSLLVDFVNYFIGREAHKASIAEGNYEVDNGDTLTDITNDYYISNVNTKLRKFTLSSNSDLFIYDYKTDGELKKITLIDFLNRNKENEDFYELYNIKYSNGNTLMLEEIFLP